MLYTRKLARAAVALLAVTALAACEDDKDLVNPPLTEGAMFLRYAALGNSITAGYQSSGISDSTQRESYAKLFAEAVGTRYAYAAVADPGCPPPIANIQTGVRVGGSATATCALRDPNSATLFLNNFAVPGVTVFDPDSIYTSASNLLTSLVLGGKTQVERALELDPTFATVWVGNNDVLEAAGSGLLTATPGISRGVTDSVVFFEQYAKMIDHLMDGQSLRGGALFGVVDVTNIPLLFPVAALFDPAFKAGFDAYAGTTTTVLANCAGVTHRVSFAIVRAIRAGQHPAVISCQAGVPAPPVGDIFILDPTEQQRIAQTVAAYNAFIQATAEEIGFAYVDVNPTLAALRASGQVPLVPNLASATATFGPFISLDGVHPTGRAHLLIANALIAAVNAEYGTTIEPIPVP